jgi:branched-chain amino acid transport system permease protein
MDFAFFLIQMLNGLQYGLLLFLVASGLTLIFGIMGVINLAHGSFYMVGAYLAWSLAGMTGSLTLDPAGRRGAHRGARHGAGMAAVPPPLPARPPLPGAADLRPDPLSKNCAAMIWGDDVHGVPVPALLNASIPLTDNLSYPGVPTVHVRRVPAAGIGCTS